MDKDHLRNIKTFFQDYRRMPSYSEIMQMAGFKSKEAVRKLVNRLMKAGFIEKDKKGKIIPSRFFSGVPLLGYVEAGWPSPAEEELKDTLDMDEYLIRNKEATFMLKVSGDSMINEGIKPGDMVLVERRSDAKNGDIVIAQVDKKWALKYFRKEKNKVWLESANPKYKPIYPREELQIAAVVIAVVRKYGA